MDSIKASMTIVSTEGNVVTLHRSSAWRVGRVNAERAMFAEACRKLRNAGYRDAAKIVLAVATGRG